MQSSTLTTGELAPDFNLTEVHGKKYSLTSLVKNGPVILEFLRGTW